MIPTSTTLEDPSAERKGLLYHLVPPPAPFSATRPVIALSFLADVPPSPESSTALNAPFHFILICGTADRTLRWAVYSSLFHRGLRRPSTISKRPLYLVLIPPLRDCTP